MFVFVFVVVLVRGIGCFYFNYIAERFRIIICVSSVRVDFYYFLLFYLCNNGIYVIFTLVLLLLLLILFIIGGLGIFGINGLAVILLLLLQVFIILLFVELRLRSLQLKVFKFLLVNV